MVSHKAGTKCVCASVQVTANLRHGDEIELCMAFQADYPGNCKSVIHALIMAHNVRKEEVDSHKVR